MDLHRPWEESLISQNALEYITTIFFAERSGLERVDEPVSFGVPFPHGKVIRQDQLILTDRFDSPLPLQIQTLNRWPDGSVKWALLDFLASVPASTTVSYQLFHAADAALVRGQNGIVIRQAPDALELDTGDCVFRVNTVVCKPFDQVTVKGVRCLEEGGSQILLIDNAGREYIPRIQAVSTECAGPVRTTLHLRGSFSSAHDPRYADFFARINFYLQSGFTELKFTLRNPRMAHHPNGLWDLGDKGSLYFQDLSIFVEVGTVAAPTVAWSTGLGRPLTEQNCSALEIYQDSSGGQNWRSTNHVNRFGQVTTQFCGFHVRRDKVVVEQGKRALPTVSISAPEKSVTGTIAGFWQNFPKALEVEDRRLALRLFPMQYSDMHELQGGEQKTHMIGLCFASSPVSTSDWFHDRLRPQLSPQWYAETRAFPYVSPRQVMKATGSSIDAAEQLVDSAVEGENTFFDRREIIDEYGWRHFGDLYADHEAIGWTGEHPLVAHYNNQYDVVYGALVQYVRSGNPRWFSLADDLAKHVIDIDIYHTQEDRPAFNGGLFWHTEHYSDAATATHRAYSKANTEGREAHQCGGGPSNEHNYTTGLLLYYFLTGDLLAKETVQGLADWVINLDDERRPIFRLFDRRPTGLCSTTVSRDYHGPGRGCGNSINALLDVYSLTQERHYLTKAEELIRRCIHPQEAIAARNLSDIEHRWSYTVFLQVLGKYLDLKIEYASLDFMYHYARQSLLHYAKWMMEHEVPYSQVLDRVEIPTETWPAQDIRKSNVFKFAARYADEPLRSQLLERAKFFFEACLRDLSSFDTCRLTRPIVLLMTNAFVYSAPSEPVEIPSSETCEIYNFGKPKKFIPHLYELYKAREWMLRSLDAFQRRKKSLMNYFVQTGRACGGARG